jgi:hypothetical protein
MEWIQRISGDNGSWDELEHIVGCCPERTKPMNEPNRGRMTMRKLQFQCEEDF